jgi:flagellar basal-body rod modification protein FlgD
MSAISALPAGIPAAQPATPRAPKAALDQADFLALLTAQLKNQDPTKPVDNMQYVQQMAMFSQIAATTEGNSQLTAIADRLDRLIALSTPTTPPTQGA